VLLDIFGQLISRGLKCLLPCGVATNLGLAVKSRKWSMLKIEMNVPDGRALALKRNPEKAVFRRF
jgi:hypothetical protein